MDKRDNHDDDSWITASLSSDELESHVACGVLWTSLEFSKNQRILLEIAHMYIRIQASRVQNIDVGPNIPSRTSV